MQASHFAVRQIGACGIVRIGEIDYPRFGRHRGQYRIDIGAQILLRHHHRHRAVGQCDDPVNHKGVLGEDDLIARPEIGIAEHLQQFVRAIAAANDARGVEPEGCPDRLAQNPRAAFGILFEILLRLGIGGNGLRAWAQRVLVGGKLVDFGHAR